MANNKPFANLDQLSKKILPAIPPFEPKVNQGPPRDVVNTLYADQLGLGNRFDQPSYKTTSHLAQFFLSDKATGADANTKFRTTISLGDRLDQPDVGSTNHLSQFFLSDVFTGVITIKPVIKDTEPSAELKDFVKSIQIIKPAPPKINGGQLPQQIEFEPVQGNGEEPSLPVRDISARQGIIVPSSGEPISGITILFPQTPDQKLAQQGIVLVNGALLSNTVVEEPVEEVAQGGTDINPTTPTVKPQGGTKPTPAISELAIQAAQGIMQEQSTLKSAIELTVPVKELPQGVVTIGSSQESLVSLTLPAATVNQGFVNDESAIVISSPPGELRNTILGAQSPDLTSPSPVDSLISNQGIVLNTLGYSLTGLALIATPTLVQGGELPQNELPGEGGHQLVDIRAAKVSILLNPPIGTTTYNRAQLTTGITAGGSLQKYDNAGDVSPTIQFINTEQYATQQRQQAAIDLLNTEGQNEDAVDYLVLINPDNAKFNNLIRQSALSRNSSVKDLVDSDGQPNKNSTTADALAAGGASYPDLAADDGQVQSTLSNLLTSKITNDKIKEYKRGFTNKNYKVYTEVNSYSQIVQSTSQAPASDQKRNNYTIQISSVENEANNVVFDAFIKTFSDALNVSFADFNHIGQQDTFKVFKGTTRQISLGFSAVAMKGTRDFTNSDVEAKAMLTKINKLMTICGVGEVNSNYIRGPIVRVTVVGLVKDLICACGSVKVDVPVDENTWDVDTQLPQMYDISLDLAVLAMDGDQLLTKKGNFYNLG